MAFTAWLIAPAPIAWISTRPWVLTTPAIAPATRTGCEVAETLSTSTGVAALPPVGVVGIDKLVKVLKCDADSKPKKVGMARQAATPPSCGANGTGRRG